MSRFLPATKRDIKRLEALVIMTQKELADGLLAIQTKVGKDAVEQATRFDALSAKIAELEQIIADGGDATPEVTAALEGVKTALQSLDDTMWWRCAEPTGPGGSMSPGEPMG